MMIMIIIIIIIIAIIIIIYTDSYLYGFYDSVFHDFSQSFYEEFILN